MSEQEKSGYKNSGPPDLQKLKKDAQKIFVDGKPFDVPEKGSLGLLALGYRGIFAWRGKRALEKNK